MINRQELLAILVSAEKHLQKWLDLDLCECEGGHSCGRDKVEANVAEMSDAITSLREAEPKAWFTEDYNEDRSATAYSLAVDARIEAQYG